MVQVLTDVTKRLVLPGAEPTMKLNLGSVLKVDTPKQEKGRDTPKQEKVREPHLAQTNEPLPRISTPCPPRFSVLILTPQSPSLSPCAGECGHTGLSARVQAGL